MATVSIPVNVILASKSPRRKQLLEEAGVKFTVFCFMNFTVYLIK